MAVKVRLHKRKIRNRVTVVKSHARKRRTKKNYSKNVIPYLGIEGLHDAAKSPPRIKPPQISLTA